MDFEKEFAEQHPDIADVLRHLKELNRLQKIATDPQEIPLTWVSETGRRAW